MSTITKRILLSIIGILAGIITWPFTELLLSNQSSFTSYFIFSLIQGGIFGFIIGSLFGLSEGLLTKNNRSMVTGSLMGAIIGLLGGALGAVIAQKMLFIIGDNLFTSYSLRESFAIPISRAVGFSILGIFVGITEGLRAKSLRKVFVGFLGGLLGGFLGGFLMELLNSFYPEIIYTRLIGLILLAFFIGTFYGLIEKRFATGVLQVLNGDLKRREFLLNQKTLVIGAKDTCDITMANYKALEDLHATITEEKGEIVIRSNSPETKLLINDKPVEKQILKYEDVIKLGDVKMFYKHK